ncbi:SpnT [Klebsiella pneumoniae]|nr:SpnT [Klebsiella pneumoniae]
MAGGLNKKQRERLNALSHGELLTVIDDLIQDNKQAKTTLINKYLLSDDDLLKAVQKEYAKLSKSTRFYDYYTADARFHELPRIIAEPLKKTARHASRANGRVVRKNHTWI